MKTHSMKRHLDEEEDSFETSSLSDEEVSADFFGDCNSRTTTFSQLSEFPDSEMPKPFFQNGMDVPFTEAVSFSKTFYELTISKSCQATVYYN